MLATAPLGLPIVRCTSGGNGGSVPLATLNDQLKSAGSVSVFGPASSRSWSCTWPAKIVTVHCSAAMQVTLVVREGQRPVPANVALSCWPLAAQVRSNHAPITSTGSVKVTWIVASRGAFTPLLRGSVARTSGPSSTIGGVRRGLGTFVTKSFPFWLVSVLPLPRRKIAVVLLGEGAVLVPSLQSAVLP